MPYRPRHPIASLCLTGLLAAAPAAGRAQSTAQDDDGIFANRPAFSRGEVPPKRIARCEELRAMAEGLPAAEFRIDLAATGALRLVKTDGALWYLVICSDLRVMCVAYQANDMKVGDVVTVRGAYRRLDTDHAVLDPCLADRGAPQ